LKKNDLIELDITKYAYEGKGIAKIPMEVKTEHQDTKELYALQEEQKNFVIFVSGSYPGDKVLAMITKVKKSYAEARTVEILKPSEERVTAGCKFFGVCGGCKQQDLNYESQLKYKQEQALDILEHLGGFKDFEYQNIAPSANIFYYRNKMEYSFADRRWLRKEEIDTDVERNFALGLHLPNIYDKVLDIDECFLQSAGSNKILNFTREFFKQRNITIYSTKTHSGYLRNLIIKKTHHSNDLMVNLVTSGENHELLTEYKNGLLEAVPEVTTVINNINEKMGQTAFGDYEIIYHGDGYIYETIGGFKFRISASSFFQTNTLQAELLYKTALDFGMINKNDVVYDLYSGAGTISVYISNSAREVFAFETVEASVRDAESNRQLNGVENVHFITADLNRSFLQIVDKNKIPEPNVIIIDPPRGGMNPVTIRDVVKLAPERIVYISCNPATQVRDMKLFREEGYRLIKVKPVDMFPHTYHIESVALLEK